MPSCAVLAGTQESVGTAIQQASQAGFQGNQAIIIVAIAMSESGLWTHAINQCDVGSNGCQGSFGILQINCAHFGETFKSASSSQQYTMSQATAFDPQLSFYFALTLSSGGQNFGAWGSYTNGSYQANIPTVTAAYNGTPPLSNSGAKGYESFPPYSGEPWYEFPNLRNFGVGSEHGTDIEVPPDTPMTAILPGTITQIGYMPWGGQITWKLDDPNAAHGIPYEYVIHLDAINPNLSVGMHIEAGTFLGYSGGETTLSNPGFSGFPNLPGGLSHHYTGTQYSTGPHEEIGLSEGPSYGSGAGYTLTIDPSFLLSQAQAENLPFGTSIQAGTGGSPPSSYNTYSSNTNGGLLNTPLGWIFGASNAPPYDALALQVHKTLVQNPGFYGIALALDEAEQFPGYYNAISPSDIATPWNIPGDVISSVVGTVVGNTLPLLIRGGMIMLGMFMLMALLWQLTKPAFEFLPELLEVAAIAA